MKIATLGGLREYMQRTISLIGNDFTAPTDDWEPVYIIQGPSGLEVIDFAGDWFASGVSKDALGEVLRPRAAEAYRYALLINGHGVNPETTPPETLERYQNGELRIEQIEGAVEFLTLTVGDAEQEEIWMATIGRNEQMIRTLGEWKKMDGSIGRFTGLNEYMRAGR